MLSVREPLISPLYVQREPNAPIDLGITAVEVTVDGATYRENAHVQMTFTPSERLVFRIPNTSDAMRFNRLGFRLLQQGETKLSLPDRGQVFDVLCVSSSTNAGLTMIPKSSVVMATPPSAAIRNAVFHLFNLPDFFGSQDYVMTFGESAQDGWIRCGRVHLESDGWGITIAATSETRDLCKALREQGGFIITHMGRIERADRSTFSSDQLIDLLCCLHLFLSFALGRWAGVGLPVGLDQHGNRVFEQWGLPRVAASHWSGGCSWFDEHHGELLSEVFPGFRSLWNDPTWRATLTAATYWYVAASDRATGMGVDTGILLAQIALERLAWTRCGLGRGTVKRKGRKRGGLEAADKLRSLLRILSLSSAIPEEFPTLQAQFNDGPEAITRIRNSLVHPGKHTSFPTDCYAEAWRLSLWYLDLVLLRVCGHAGNYANRCNSRRWVGEVERIPQGGTTPTLGR